MMTNTVTIHSDEAVGLMKAATLAGVHLSTIYKERAKLSAFKKGKSWFVPLDSLRRYISDRAKRAEGVIATMDLPSR
jgi:hypothetical protein